MKIGDIVKGLNAGVGIDLSLDEKTAYYVEWSIGELCKVEVNTGKVTRVISGLKYPEDVEVDWATGDIFVSQRTGEIIRITKDKTSEDIYIPGGAPQQLALVKESGKRYLYTVCYDSGNLFRIDVDKKTAINIKTGFGHPVGLVIDAAHKYAYITEQDKSSLTKVDLSTKSVSILKTGLVWPFFLSWDRDASGIFCVQRDPANSLVKFKLGPPVALQTVASGLAFRPSGVAPNKDNKKIYICADQKLQLIAFDGVPPIAPGPVPFTVESIQFNYDGSKAIPLKDHVTNNYIPTPEWTKGGDNEPAAYVQGTKAHIKVVFREGPGYIAGATYAVSAIGNLGGVRRKDVTPVFHPNNLTNPIDFELMWPLPHAIGKHTVTMEWYARKIPATIPTHFDSTKHTICTTWKKITPVQDKDKHLEDWVYKKPMLWTSEWAAGKTNERDICDAIIKNLHKSGLKYGKRLSKTRPYVRRVLDDEIGMCGEWYYTFQHFVHCQGVFVHRRFYYVDWRDLPNNEVKWCAIVIKSGGLNQPQPTYGASEFHDVEDYPITMNTPIKTITQKRYRFWGIPGGKDDGHGINFLKYNNKLYLYDASFGTGPFEIALFNTADGLPPKNLSIVGGKELASFKKSYLDKAVDYMLGTLYHGTKLYKTEYKVANGITVRTLKIPDESAGFKEITFIWYGPM